MPDEKLTDSEIVKALEHCVQKFSCTSCPLYKSKSSCGGYFLEVINRLQAELEDLREIVFTDRTEAFKLLKAETYKEFAERLKSYLHQDDFETPDERWKPESEFANLIDNLLKELVGEDK